MSATEQNGSNQHPEEATSKWEWVTAVFGGLIVAATLAYMVYFGLSHPDGPPEPVVEHIATIAAEEGYLVRFKVSNEGNSTAAGLLIRGELVDDGSVLEQSEATIDYLPQISNREGGLFFTRNPQEFEIRLTARGYSAP